MNKAVHLFGFLCTIAMFFASGCTSDEIAGSGAASTQTQIGTGDPIEVNFSFASPAASRAAVAYTDAESTINSIHAVVFYDADADGQADDNESFVSYSEAVFTESEGTISGSFHISYTGNFTVGFIANADDDFVTSVLDGLQIGSSTVGSFSSATVSQAPEEFFMTSDFYEIALDDITSSASITEEVSMERIMARIDITNGADGIDITSVSFHNRGIKSTVYGVNTTTSSDYYASEAVTYSADTDGEVLIAGSSENPGSLEGVIYTYEQYNAPGSEGSPYLTLTCSIDDAEEASTYTVYFSDTEGNPIPLKRNNKYTLSIARLDLGVEFALTVTDWSEGETLTVTNLELAAGNSEQQQQQLNSQLLLAGLFTEEYNVATFDSSTGEVTFATDHTTCHNQEAFPTFTSLQSGGYAGKQTEGSYTEAYKTFTCEGKEYRLPTYGELLLLLPVYDSSSLTHVLFQSTSKSWDLSTETIYLDNNLSTGIRDTEGRQVTGTRNFKQGSATTAYVTSSYIVYATRFVGSDQAAAYRYTLEPLEGDHKFSLVIKVKGLPYRGFTSSIDVVADESFWADDVCLTYTFPASGYYSGSTHINRGTFGYCSSSSLSESGDSYAHYLHFYSSSASVRNGYHVEHGRPLRLVAVSND